MAFLCNNPGGNGCFSGIIVMLRWPARLGETERGYGDTVILNGTKWSEGSVTDSSLTLRMTGRRSVIDEVAEP